MKLHEVYGTSLSLVTDLYQLTMAYGYWKDGTADRESVFHLFFRKNPFQGGYTVAAGLQTAVEYLTSFSFASDDIEYLATLTGNDSQPLFERAFLDYLADMKLGIDIDAAPEGTVVFPHQPILRVRGPLIQAQLLETALLNIINFQTLIATKSSRICRAAAGQDVLEFGLRRAQGIDGGLSASRAAYIGGAAATSNVLAGKVFGIPVKGTHAHSWVMSFEDEQASFEAYAAAIPNNCVFLVDTYDTIEGVKKAISVGKRLRDSGHLMVGIRLDSGDLAFLSIEASKLLDEAGFSEAVIVASNDLDEHLIESLRRQGAQIAVWGVGTKLATAADQPALGGVYKLGALKDADGNWLPKVKLSEQLIKVSTPGILQVRRYFDEKVARADMVYNELQELPKTCTIVDPHDPSRRRKHGSEFHFEDLLKPIFRGGELVAECPSLEMIRERTKQQLEAFHESILRLDNPHGYPVGLEQQLHELKTEIVFRLRGEAKHE
jgi:nicotinate phosphoribosyltransferase